MNERTAPRFSALVLPYAAFALVAACVSAAGRRPVPIVFVTSGANYGLVVGASNGSKWLDWKKGHVYIKGGERFRFFTTSGSSSTSTLTKPVLSQASGAAYTVTVKRAGEKSPELGIPASVRWKLAPRAVKELPKNDAALKNSAADFLKLKGLTAPQIEIMRVRQCDLDGDGAKETLIETHSPNRRKQMQEGAASTVGQFSLVLLRQSNGKVSKVGGDINTKAGDGDGFYQYYELAHLFDLNGDGRMEIVVESSYHEGGGADIYEWKRGKVRLLVSASDGL
jgi:hypothetical protein